jgi:predicted Fe-S protein YdhL (DUF1289 family)
MATQADDDACVGCVQVHEEHTPHRLASSDGQRKVSQSFKVRRLGIQGGSGAL